MKELQKYVLLAVLAGAVLAGCRNDDDEPCCDPTNPECPNYDPCHGKIETSAHFTIAQQYSPFGENANVFIEDDIVTGGTLKFSAMPQEGAVYTWVLGADTIVGGHEVTMPLGSLPVGTYGNSLIVTKTPDTLCFPSDTGVDQYFRSFTRIDGCDVAFLGRFRGVFSSLPSDSIEIELVGSSSINSIEPCNEPSNSSAIFAINFNLENDSVRLYSNGGVNSRYSFESLGTVGTPEGEFIYDSSADQATASYTIDGQPYSFTGRKL